MKFLGWLRHHRAMRPRLALPMGLLVLATIGLACGSPGGPPGAVHVLEADGTVGPVMAQFIDRAIGNAEDKQAGAVVIELDTPGGLSSSMDDIVQDILTADLPVIVYVSPPGGRAASAGTFITMAAHVAAMAPGTSIGAATPVGAGGEDIEGALGSKVVNDAAARIRSIAEQRGRNADWAESAVREAVSAGAEEALELNVVDLVAETLDQLLAAVDGREVELHSGETVVLRTADALTDEALLVRVKPNLAERLLDIISDPNIAFLLISLGSIALFFELINPGAIFPGVFGVIALILGFFSLTVIPFELAGVALILAAFVLFFLEIFVTSGGVLGAGGVVSLILGGLFFTSGNPSFAGPDIEVNRWLIYGVASAIGAFFLFVIMSIIRARRLAPSMGIQTMVGRQAVALSTLDPTGYVMFEGENWSAEAEGGPVQSGERVVITDVQGLKLRVKRDTERS